MDLGDMAMIQKYVADLAAKNGISELRVSHENGVRLGCKGMHLVNLGSNGKYVSALVSQSDIFGLQNGSECVQLNMKIQTALDRLKLLLES